MHNLPDDAQKILIDIDEVLAEHVAAFKPFVAETLNVRVEDLHPTPDWDFKAWFDGSDLHWRDVHAGAVQRGMLLTMAPKKDAVEVVNALYQFNHIIICTSRTADTQSVCDTVDWLRMHGIRYDDLAFLEDKSILDVDWRIDDSPHHAEAFRAKGQKYVIFDAWYNQGAVGPRVRSWADIHKMFHKALVAQVNPL